MDGGNGSKRSNGTIFGREPALVLGLVGAGITLGLTFGLALSVEQVGAILAFVNVALAFWTRSRVTPVARAGGVTDKTA